MVRTNPVSIIYRGSRSILNLSTIVPMLLYDHNHTGALTAKSGSIDVFGTQGSRLLALIDTIVTHRTILFHPKVPLLASE